MRTDEDVISEILLANANGIPLFAYRVTGPDGQAEITTERSEAMQWAVDIAAATGGPVRIDKCRVEEDAALTPIATKSIYVDGGYWHEPGEI